MLDELAELRARVARLEAERAVISTFNEYFYNMDIGYTDGILDVFAEDALLEVINFNARRRRRMFDWDAESKGS